MNPYGTPANLIPKPAQPGNKRAVGNKGGRPRKELAGLADEGADRVLRECLAILDSPGKGKAGEARKRWAIAQISYLCKGRIPKRLEITGEDGGLLSIGVVTRRESEQPTTPSDSEPEQASDNE